MHLDCRVRGVSASISPSGCFDNLRFKFNLGTIFSSGCKKGAGEKVSVILRKYLRRIFAKEFPKFKFRNVYLKSAIAIRLFFLYK